MARIVWTEPALSDLNDIAEYIALDKVRAAEHLVEKVFSVVERLEQFPASKGTLPFDYSTPHKGYRHLCFKSPALLSFL